jgi:hypothetical protein
LRLRVEVLFSPALEPLLALGQLVGLYKRSVAGDLRPRRERRSLIPAYDLQATHRPDSKGDEKSHDRYHLLKSFEEITI